MIDPGSLKHRFVLERPVKTSDGQGGHDTTWAEVSRPWGGFWNPRSREGEFAQGRVGSVSTRVVIRYRSGVTQAMRLRLGERIFQIEGPPRDLLDEKEYLELTCREVTP